MDDANQSEIDSLMDSIEQDSSDTESASETAVEESASSEDTGESLNIQEEVKAEDMGEADEGPKGRPWVDFVPFFQHVKPNSYIGRLEEEIKNKNEMLRDKEDLKLWCLEGNIHKSYYGLWRTSSNLYMRNIVKLTKRLRSEKSGKPLEES